MRKFTILALAFLLIGVQVFADVTLELEPKATVKAEAKLEVAFDFDADFGRGDFVLNNSTDVDVIIDLIEKQTLTKGNEEGTEEAVIGFIEVKDIQSQLTRKNQDNIRLSASPNSAEQEQIDNFTRIINEASNRRNDLLGIPGGDRNADQNRELARLQELITQATADRTAIFSQLESRGRNLNVPFDVVKSPSITARVNFIGPNLYLQVSTIDQDFELDVFQNFTIFKEQRGFAGEIEQTTEMDVDTQGELGSLAIGTINDIIDASVVLADEGRDADDLSVGINLNLKVLKDITGLTIKAGAIFDNEEFGAFRFAPRQNADIGNVTGGIAFGGNIEWNLNAIDSLKEMLGDNINVAAGFSYEGITFLGGTNNDVFSEVSARLGANLWGATVDLYWATDLGINGIEDDTQDTALHDIRFKVSTDKLAIGDFNLNDIFKFTLTLDAAIDRGALLGLKTEFDLNIIKDILVPYFNFTLLEDSRNREPANVNFEYQIRTGVRIPLIENVDFDIFYENDDLANSSARSGDNEALGKVGIVTSVKI